MAVPGSASVRTLFFFFVTLGLEMSDTKSRRASKTSPPRNRIASLRSSCSWTLHPQLSTTKQVRHRGGGASIGVCPDRGAPRPLRRACQGPADARNPQPSTLNPQPSTHNPELLNLTPNSLTLNPQPSTPNPNPQTPHPKPQTLNPKP